MGFAGKIVLLTGASRGIGRAMAAQLAQAGAQVLAVARQPVPGFDSFAVDLAEPGAAEAIADWVARAHPDCSVLINNAAIMEHTRYTTTDPAHAAAIRREVAINLTAPLSLCVAMLPHLPAGGVICNVTSGLAIQPTAEAATYCATKAGLRAFTKALRYQVEDAQRGIQVSEAIMTLVDTTLSHGDPLRKLAPEAAAREVLAGIAAGKREIWVERTKLLRVINRVSPGMAARILR